MLLGLLLVIQIIVCAALVGVILLQRSEGGALGMGGGPAGFMTARGAGDLLTRTTSILAAVFFILSIVLTVVAGQQHAGSSVVDRLKVDALNPDALKPKTPPPPATPAPAPAGQPAPAQPAGPNVFSAPTPQVNTAPSTVNSVFNAPAPAAPQGQTKPATSK